ncbi:Apolipoprotein L domain-containing protein 1 [Collichthys lucidus]|uniref:Apolipoprotein L domain-containing protein 1 n=1 Tax=Collichthys lucidus TaxID=240159 RepID=A0A4U5VYD2_COLLU|nr:Apolipoprotein L domain-containing protein 1 [Collichthys lucidus]
MRGDAATENEVEADDYGGGVAAAETSGERRPSIVKLQSMLKKVSQSPFHSRYKDDDLPAAATGVTDNQPLHSEQESGNKGHLVEDAPSEGNLDAIFVPPPEFQSSPLDLQTDPEAEPSEPPLQDHFQTPTLARNPSTNGHFRDVTLNSPDLFRPVPAQRKNLSKTLELKSSELIKDEGVDLFQDAKGEDLFHAGHTKEVNLFEKSPSIFTDPFRSPSNKEVDPFQSPQPVVSNPFQTDGADLFQTLPTKNGEHPSATEDLFGMSSKNDLDIFSPSATNSVDPFPSPITMDLFQNVSSLEDPFGPTPSKQYNPFHSSNGTPDIFQPLKTKDIFEITPSSATSVAAPSFNSPSEMELDTLPSLPDLFKATPSGSNLDIQPKSPDEIVLTTPQGTKHDILLPTPFTRARNLSMSLSQSPSEMTHVSTFRRPPKPLPRIRRPSKEKPPRPEKPPKPEKPPTPANSIEPVVPKTSPKLAFRPLPIPAVRLKPKTPENKPTDPENYVIFEDILLTGQMKADSDGGSGEDQEGSGSHGKDKFADETKDGRSRTLPTTRKSSKDFFSDMHMSAEECEDAEQNGMDSKKNHLKTKVNRLLRRASTFSSVPEKTHMNGHVPEELKDGDLNKKSIRKKDSVRRWSEFVFFLKHKRSSSRTVHMMQRFVVDRERLWTTAPVTRRKYEELSTKRWAAMDFYDFATRHMDAIIAVCHQVDDDFVFSLQKRKKKVKIKFVPQRGFAIMKTDAEPKGAHGYTPRKGSKEKSQDEVHGAHGYTPRKKSQAHAFMEDEQFQKMRRPSVGLDEDEDPYKTADCRPKKPTKKLLHVGRRSSKEDMLDESSSQKKKSSFSADELDDGKLNGVEDCKPGVFAEDDIFKKGKEELYDSEEDLETCKATKPSKRKGLKKHKAKSKAMQPEWEDPPGATSSDFLSEAAKAEWLAAQMDERAMAGLEDEDEDGDTDSLMEWWDTVEQWDEVASDEEDKIMKQDESKSFTILADKVYRGLRLFNKVFTERAEVLWQSIITLHAIADDISNFHHKAKIAGITGGTTTAVGGVAAIAGLVMSPFTFGASLIVTAVGVGVATAGGIASASAAISDNVNNMHDRKKVEIVLQEYEGHLKDIGKILHFVNEGVYKLRGHPFLRSGTQHYSSDWEIRRAVQMICLVDSPVMRATEITDKAITSVQGLFRGMDRFFIKDSRELKKGCKKEVVAQIKEVANILNDGIVELNAIREELQDATGSV